MRYLSRRWGKSWQGNTEDELLIPIRDEFHPIDTQDQEDIVRSFERQYARQNAIWRVIFAVLIIILATFFILSIASQIISPWDLRYHAYFMDEVDSWKIISADGIAVLVCLMVLRGFVYHTMMFHRRWIWYSGYPGIVLAVFWLYQMMRLPKFYWDIIWLPFGPLSLAGICLYTDVQLEECLEEVKKLRGFMYSYKSR